MVQWLRISLPMLGTQVWSLVGELRSYIAAGQLSLCATTTEPTRSGTHVPQLESLCTAVTIPHAETKTQHSQTNVSVLDALSCPTLCDPWTVARQAPLSMGFSRQEYWGGLPFPSSEDLPGPGIEPWSPALQAGSLPTKPRGKPVK